MKYGYKFSNLCGVVYKNGNVVFTPDGNSLLSPVGNRVTCFDLVGHSSFTLDFETRSDISKIALSPDGRLLLAVDVDGYAVAVNFTRRVIVHRFNFKAPVKDLRFSPDGGYLAVTHGRKLQVWRAPGLEREFSPFVLHRVYTGHYDDITALGWSPNGKYIVTGSRDNTARIYSLHPMPGFIPVTLSGHRDRLISVFFAEEDVIYTLSRDSCLLVWRWTERALPTRVAEEQLEDEEDDSEDGDGAGTKRRRSGGLSASDPAVRALKRARLETARAEAGLGSEEEDEDDEEEDEEEEEVEEEETEDSESSSSSSSSSDSSDSAEEGDEPAVTAARRSAAAGAGLLETHDETAAESSGRKTWRAGVSRVGGRGQSVKKATDVLATRMRHRVPAPYEEATRYAEELAAEQGPGRKEAVLSILQGEWVQSARHIFKGADGVVQKVKSGAYHAGNSLLTVGFANGVFGLYTMPDATCVHTLSMSQHEVTAAAVNSSGEWVAFGSATLGQLLVWEWTTETYVLKQQGHFYDVNAVAYSPNGHLMVTGGDDGKVKVWNTASGFCFVTFSDHTAPVTAVTFIGGNKSGGGGHGLAVLSASLDGTVRAYDLIRYRNFRTLSGPDASPAQYISLACDDSGEVVCAGTMDPFTIHVWSLQTGKLTDVLSGHEGPVSSLSFSASAGLLASASWDKTVRVWDVFRTGTATETFRHGSDVLVVAWRPDGKQLAASTLDGYIHFWDAKNGVETGSIDGRRDAAGGRKHNDVRTAASTAAGKCFTAITYTADGECVLATGRTKYVCLYAVAPQLLIRKWQFSHNRSLDGILDKLSSKGMGEAGALATLNVEDPHADDLADARKKQDETLPGVRRGAASMARTTHPEIRGKAIVFSPSGRSFAVATTEGLLIYSLDDTLVFDPLDVGEDVTPEAIEAACEDRHYGRALLMALHLNETHLIAKVVEEVPLVAVPLMATVVPVPFLARMLDYVSTKLTAGAPGASPHVQFYLAWAQGLLQAHARTLRDGVGAGASSAMAAGLSACGPALRALQKALVAHKDTLVRIVDSNKYALAFLTGAAAVFATEADHAEAKSLLLADAPAAAGGGAGDSAAELAVLTAAGGKSAGSGAGKSLAEALAGKVEGSSNKKKASKKSKGGAAA